MCGPSKTTVDLFVNEDKVSPKAYFKLLIRCIELQIEVKANFAEKFRFDELLEQPSVLVKNRNLKEDLKSYIHFRKETELSFIEDTVSDRCYLPTCSEIIVILYIFL